ncbi:hypothetical protein EDD16DRAFT_1529108 [Pisolithus croceorrhizus]|nr:hypothetical protein EDD16DRAFT_1529108 [Pisolithus croceorrhizus]
MSSCRAFNISPSMIHLQAFYWLKQFAEGSILLNMALDSIKFTLGSNFKSNQWMNLTHCIVMELDCWPAIEKIFMQELGIVGSSSVFESLSPELHSQPSQVSTMSDTQESSSSTEARASPPSVSGIQEYSSSTAVPLLKDPSAWRLMMDWAQDKIGFSELDDRMRAYGPHYIPEEWKVLIDEVFMLSDPGVESTSSPSLVIKEQWSHRALASTRSTSSSQSATHHHRKSCGVTQSKCHKLNSSIFLHIDAEDEGEEDEGEEEEEDEEGRRNYGPQQVGPSGKGSYLRTIDTLCEQFHCGAREATVSNDPLVMQLPTSIFPPPHNNIYIVEFYSASARTFTFEYIKTQGFEVTTLPWLPHRLYVEASCPLEVQQSLPPLTVEVIKKLFFCHLQEGTSILVYKAQQVLPTRNWVRIKQSAYKGDIGTLNIFSSQLWQEHDSVQIREGDLRGKRGVLADVDLHKRSAVVLCDGDAFSCNLQELCRVFKIGDTRTLVLIVMQPDKTSDNFTRFQGTKPSQVTCEPPNTLTFTKDKGYNVAVGDTVEVVRGQWCDSQGIVKAVDLTKASLDIMCPTDRVQINVPITFSRKIMERFEHGLSKFVSRDVWVIAGDKKGSWAMLRTIRRMSCWVGLFGQAIQLKNNQIATPSIGVTPPPSPGPSNAGLSDAWTITPADITQTQTPDYGLAIQHLTIPAQYLMPANPTGKNQLCLILKGPQAGQVVRIKKCQRASKSVVTEDVFCLNSFDGLMFYQDNYIFLLWNLLWLAPIDDGLEGFTQLSLPFIIVGWRYTKVLLPSPNMGLVHSRFAGVLSSQGQDLALGSPPNISRTASPVEVTQKCKFCEDRDSALGPPLKISCGTSLTIQTSAINIQPISPVPPVITSLKCKASEDQDLALAHPAKIPRIPSLGAAASSGRLPNELLAHITTLLPLKLPSGIDSSMPAIQRNHCAHVFLHCLDSTPLKMTTNYHLWQGGPSSAPTSVLRARQTDPFILAPAGKHPRVRMQGIDLLRLGMGKRATGPL